MLRRGKKLQMIPPMTLPGQRANRYGTNIGGYGILAIPTLPLVSNNSLNKLIAWVWQDAIPSYEKATLSDGKRGFFLIYAVCGVRRPIRFRPPSDWIPSAARNISYYYTL